MVELGVAQTLQRPAWKPTEAQVAELCERYVDGESIATIAADFDVEYKHVHYRLRAAGVPRRKAWGHPRAVTCTECGTSFTALNSNAQFCSKICQYGQADCEWCGATFTKRAPNSATLAKNNRQNVFCSRACEARGRRVPDDRRVTDEGYVVIRLPDNWPYQGERYNGTMLEHRYVMSISLGRRLEKHESVHHINGDRADNRIGNLQLRQGKHGKGVKTVCLDCGSHNVGHDEL